MVLIMGLHHSSVGKSSACNAGDLGSIPGSVRYAAEGNGNPLQYSCLENPMDRGAWQATVHGITRVRHKLDTKPPPVLIILHLTLKLFSPHFFNWLGAPGGWPMYVGLYWQDPMTSDFQSGRASGEPGQEITKKDKIRSGNLFSEMSDQADCDQAQSKMVFYIQLLPLQV